MRKIVKKKDRSNELAGKKRKGVKHRCESTDKEYMWKRESKQKDRELWKRKIDSKCMRERERDRERERGGWRKRERKEMITR